MTKEERLVESLEQLLKEELELEQVIDSLPKGYISTKNISGHTYCYRQWREGARINSEYVPESILNTVKRKIATRKEQETVLKAVRKEIKSLSHILVKQNVLTEEKLEQARAKVRG